MNNLRVIYLANKVWAADNNNKFPAQVSERLGGAKEKAAKGIAFPIFQVMYNGDRYPMAVAAAIGGAQEYVAQAGVSPANLNPGMVFMVMSNELSTPKILVCPADAKRSGAVSFTTGFDNSHVSYFAGLDADPDDAGRLLFGDSNLAIAGKPVKKGLLLISKKDPVTWTSERHISRGNIVTVSSMWENSSRWHQILAQSDLATNRLAIP